MERKVTPETAKDLSKGLLHLRKSVPIGGIRARVFLIMVLFSISVCLSIGACRHMKILCTLRSNFGK